MQFSLTHISWIGVVTSLLFSFALGALWHSKIMFGKSWTKESGTPYHKGNHGNPAIIFGLTAILHLVALTALAAYIEPQSDALSGLITGVIVGTVWTATAIGATYIFAGRSLKLFLIDAGFYIVLFALSGLIIGKLQ